MNSRPLYQRRNTKTIDEIDIIIPGHFLTGLYLLEPSPSEAVNLSLAERPDTHRQIISSFWSKWKRSYLSQL